MNKELSTELAAEGEILEPENPNETEADKLTALLEDVCESLEVILNTAQLADHGMSHPREAVQQVVRIADGTLQRIKKKATELGLLIEQDEELQLLGTGD